MAAPISSRVVHALEGAWRALQKRHPDVPDAVVVLAQARQGGRTLGHFAAGRWASATGELPELYIAGEGLLLGAHEVFGTMVHEAAHGIAHVRGIDDTSRDGRYHNVRYRVLAEELGLVVTADPGIGWARTVMGSELADAYSGQIRRLEDALVLWRTHGVPSGPESGRNLVAATCRCPRRIRVAPSTLRAGPIRCGVCNKAFRAVVHRHETVAAS